MTEILVFSEAKQQHANKPYALQHNYFFKILSYMEWKIMTICRKLLIIQKHCVQSQCLHKNTCRTVVPNQEGYPPPGGCQ